MSRCLICSHRVHVPHTAVVQGEDQRARYFHFRKQRAELNWQQIHGLDLDNILKRLDIQALERVRPAALICSWSMLGTLRMSYEWQQRSAQQPNSVFQCLSEGVGTAEGVIILLG